MEFLTMSNTIQLEKDIAYCIDCLDLSNEQIGEILRACEQLGNISVEYFCEEFIVAPDGENAMKYQREDFMDLDVFNTYHGIYFEEVD